MNACNDGRLSHLVFSGGELGTIEGRKVAQGLARLGVELKHDSSL